MHYVRDVVGIALAVVGGIFLWGAGKLMTPPTKKKFVAGVMENLGL